MSRNKERVRWVMGILQSRVRSEGAKRVGETTLGRVTDRSKM